MTQQEAIDAAAAQNAALEGQSVLSVVNDTYTSIYEQTFFVHFIPSKYQTQFGNSPDYETKIAFARVNGQSVGSGVADYVSEFDTNAAADPVLSSYLGL